MPGSNLDSVIGNVAFVLSLVLAPVTAVRRVDRRAIVVSSLLGVILTAHAGLGYAGRTSLDAAAWHIPNGVLAIALATYLAARPRPITGPGVSLR